MSMYSFAVPAITFGSGTADAVDLADATFMAVAGGTALQRCSVDEVCFGGNAGTSAPMIMLLGRDSQIFASPTALASPNTFALLDANASVQTTPPIACIATTGAQPQRASSTTLPKKAFVYNAAGGVIRANYANTRDRFTIVGLSVNTGEFSFSSFTNSTAATASGGHILLEVE